MTILQAVILGFIQGLTEFLPVSSSGHLVLGQHLLKIENPDILSFDVFVHFGTLISIFLIFRREIIQILRAMWKPLTTFKWKEEYDNSEHFRIGLAIIVGSIPAGVIGIIFHDQIKDAFTDPQLVAMNLVITGLLLFLTRLTRRAEPKPMNPFKAFLIGIAQAFAILPGISRSGSTMSVAMYLKISPVQAARFSFLLSIPVIGGAALLETKNLIKHGAEIGIAPLLAGTIVAAISGYFAIKILLKIVERGKFSWFAFYCLAVGVLGIVFI
ncbi:MAG: undecaprenyl-diphosphate phosphatase [Ignavibacteriales bacterium]|nr:undecaprenyl-diphosphate phosphatase [Ignavibacteriales bacterium]